MIIDVEKEIRLVPYFFDSVVMDVREQRPVEGVMLPIFSKRRGYVSKISEIKGHVPEVISVGFLTKLLMNSV